MHGSSPFGDIGGKAVFYTVRLEIKTYHPGEPKHLIVTVSSGPVALRAALEIAHHGQH